LQVKDFKVISRTINKTRVTQSLKNIKCLKEARFREEGGTEAMGCSNNLAIHMKTQQATLQWLPEITSIEVFLNSRCQF